MKRSLAIALLIVFLAAAIGAQTPQWSPKASTDWYARQPWLVGANYVPAYAVNQLEMWQTDTFDADRIDLELSWAESLGMNTMRVFLHNLLWQEDPGGLSSFRRRIDKFLAACKRHKIRPVFVLLDSCWDPFPKGGRQLPPRPGVHNSRWVQSPGAAALADPAQEAHVLEYVEGVILAFNTDDRVLAWDVWNEPDNLNTNSYGPTEPSNKIAMVQALLPKIFQYARAGLPTQPLTSGLWQGDWSDPAKLTPIEKTQLELSDIITFHSYEGPTEFEKRIDSLQQYHRPILCTEYMARPRGSTFEAILPVAKEHKVAAYNWGLVAGKTQTFLPWDSWQQPYVNRAPSLWFHDIFTTNGKPYNQEEADFIRQIVSDQKGKKKK
jgi:Cellulase (glycosyl hydrolase family 5)